MNKILRFDIIVFIVILLFSLIFRITNLNLIEFKTDEAVNLLLASKFAPGGTVSSIGVLNPPLFNYILAPLTIITLDPKIFSLFIAFINSLAIAFFYLIVRKYYGEFIALVSSTLFAFSPWAILYSRKIWTQDLLVPFFIIAFYSIHKLIYEKRQIFWIPLSISSLFLIQLHQISILFIFLITVFLLFKIVKINLKYLLFGAILGLLPLLPYFGHEIKNNYQDFKSVYSSRKRLSSNRSLNIFLRPLQITNQGYFSFILGQDIDTFVKKYPLVNILRRLFYFEYLIIVLGIFVYFKKYKESRFLATSTIILPLLYFLFRVDPFMHYYIILLPLLFLFLGVGFKFIFEKSQIRILSFILFLSIIISSLSFNFAFFSLLKEQGSLKGDYGDSLKASLGHVKDKNYDELFLFQFIPLTYAFGYDPFAKMLYSNITQDQIPTIEDNFKDTQDPRLEQELLSFYTKEPTNLKTLDILRRKFKENPIYSNIYKVTLEDFLAKNYKKEYTSEKFDLKFFYPAHWKAEQGNSIKIEGDNLILNIYKDNVLKHFENKTESYLKILGERARKEECKINGVICGVRYFFKSYTAEIVQKGSDYKGFTNEIRAADEIFNSLRFISE